jgi:hypothetical protein
VRILAPVTEAEVIATFLRAELESERFGAPIRAALEHDGVPADVVTRPDLSDAVQNAYRRELLGGARGWGRNEGMFRNFPDDVTWLRAGFTRDEVASILYIDWDWWLTVTGGSRRPADAARKLRRESPSDVAWHEPIAWRLASGPPLPELIVIRAGDGERLVVLEGHVRLTAFALFPEALPDALDVLLGESAGLVRWTSY